MKYNKFGNTGFDISAVTYGGIVSASVLDDRLMLEDGQKQSDYFVSWAVDQGINYFDVAPTYGNAQENLGNSLAPYRKNVYLACKSNERLREKAEPEMMESPDAYRVTTVLDSVSLGLAKLEDQALRKPQSLYVRDQELYICDTGNNRIVQIHCDQEQYEVVRIISSVTASAEDYELAEGFYSKSRVYEQAIDERVDAEKKLADLNDSSQEADGTESAKAEKIEAATLELEQAQEKERLAHDDAVEAEEKA